MYFIVRRVFAAVVVALFVSLFIFLISRLAPGDPAIIIAGDAATQSQIEEIRDKLGLSKPILNQYYIWLTSILRGDFGYSYYYYKNVIDIIGQRVEPTVSLTIVTMVLAIGISLPVATLSAYKRGSATDKSIIGASVLGFSMPVFVSGYILIWVFSMRLNLFPSHGYVPFGDSPLRWLHSLLLPSTALAIVYVSLIARIARSEIIKTLKSQHVITARAKGLSSRKIFTNHVLLNSSVPIITIIGVSITTLIGGVVVTETIFALPGIGKLTIDAVLAKDFPVLQGVILIFSGVYIGINLIIDLLYVLIDPRVRYK